MKDIQLNEKPENDQKESIIVEYRSFEEFKGLSDEQVLEIDGFLKSYAELIYDCFSFSPEDQNGKVIEMNKHQNKLKAA